MSNRTAGHTKSEFFSVPEGEPDEIRAHEDAVRMDVPFGEGDIRQVTLRPRHLSALRSMYDDWWVSHWAEEHERNA